jgi:hypothetical protein
MPPLLVMALKAEEVGAIIHTTPCKSADTAMPATTGASSVPRTSSAGVRSWGAVSRGFFAVLSLDALFDLSAAATLFQKDWLVSRTGQELSSWA